jgi:hypothetical protein
MIEALVVIFIGLLGVVITDQVLKAHDKKGLLHRIFDNKYRRNYVGNKKIIKLRGTIRVQKANKQEIFTRMKLAEESLRQYRDEANKIDRLINGNEILIKEARREMV